MFLLFAESDPVELRVDCYECILTCMSNVYAQHHRLMVVLMVRFLNIFVHYIC